MWCKLTASVMAATAIAWVWVVYAQLPSGLPTSGRHWGFWARGEDFIAWFTVEPLIKHPEDPYIPPLLWEAGGNLYSDSGVPKAQVTWLGAYVYAPVWVPPVVLGSGAVMAFLLGRRRRCDGTYCRCGYELRGNMSGRGPECGAAIERLTPTPPAAPADDAGASLQPVRLSGPSRGS